MSRSTLIPRLLITLLGTAMILMGITELLLGFAGERTEAVVTDIRREGGERTDGIPGRYTYNVGYTFTLSDGREINGFSKKIGDAVFVKASGKATVSIRYISVFPYLNTLEKDAGLGAGQLALILAGGALVFFMNKKRKDGHT